MRMIKTKIRFFKKTKIFQKIYFKVLQKKVQKIFKTKIFNNKKKINNNNKFYN